MFRGVPTVKPSMRTVGLFILPVCVGALLAARTQAVHPIARASLAAVAFICLGIFLKVLRNRR